ncbi:helix-turn-helix transcriptional regulator [Chitinophaga sp. S165]|uniref:helix-turn-helix transcriptional regulator n=1 Tax=Chitinophaga sp. S165 TaxID=2135462 RepID=UPI000D713971|nr:helix-turn-helix transcriptional regulator [Chitinophaga sp. S165]PWV54533.1 AraC-like DNA-binding protein [Chitinophaga sp. S165]
MRSTLFKANKLLLIEKDKQSYIPANCLPPEYLKLIIPHAGLYFREDEECEILSQHIGAGPFSLWMHDIFAKDKIVLLPYTPYHIWTLHFMYEDSLMITGGEKPPYLLEERECNMFSLLPGLHPVPMEDNTKVLSVHINIRPEFFPKLMKKYPPLRDLLSRTIPPVSCALNDHPHPISAVCDLLVQQILTCHYTGRKAHIFIYRCILDLLLNYAQREAHAHEPFLFSSLEHRETYKQLFRFIIEHPHMNCSLAKLSRMFKLPAAELSKGFLQHYAITIEDFTHMIKMIATYKLLHKKNVSIPVIADAVGYKTPAELVKHVEAYYEFKVKK